MKYVDLNLYQGSLKFVQHRCVGELSGKDYGMNSVTQETCIIQTESAHQK